MTARMYYDADAESSARWLAAASPRASEGESRTAVDKRKTRTFQEG